MFETNAMYFTSLQQFIKSLQSLTFINIKMYTFIGFIAYQFWLQRGYHEIIQVGDIKGWNILQCTVENLNYLSVILIKYIPVITWYWPCRQQWPQLSVFWQIKDSHYNLFFLEFHQLARDKGELSSQESESRITVDPSWTSFSNNIKQDLGSLMSRAFLEIMTK